MAEFVATNKNWCFLRDNQRLRAAVERRLKELGLRGRALTQYTGLPAARIQVWRKDQTVGRLTQFDYLKLLKSLGISVDLIIEYTK